MTITRTTLGAGLALASTLCPVSDVYGQTISDRVLSDITTETTGMCTIATVNFNIRVQILSSFPQKSGRELHVRLKPLENTSRARESLRTPPAIPALRSIEYEGDNAAGPTLSLYFNRDVQFEVAAGKRPQSIIITISEPGALGCSPDDDGLNLPLNIPPQLPAQPGATPVVAQPDIPVPSGLYVVNAVSQPQAIGTLNDKQQAAIKGQIAYQSEFERDGRIWHRLRVGFFDSREQAENARKKLTGTFPEAFVVKVTAQERQQGVATRLASAALPPIATRVAPSAPLSPDDAAKSVQLEADAEAAIKAGDNDRAIQILTNALALPENERTPRALELLGLTRERKGQIAHARAEFEEYLRRYPTGEGSDRVRQRLAGLGGAAQPAGPGELRTPSRTEGRTASLREWRWGVRGSFSQFYYRDQTTTKFVDASRLDPTAEVDNSVNINQLLSNLDVSASGGNNRVQLLLRGAGSYTKDFRSNGRDLKALSALYLDVSDSTLGLSARVGRQTRNGSGVLGRFDGGLLGLQVMPRLRVNAVAGFPVYSSRQTHILNDRFFWGLSADIGSKKDKWQTTLYWFDQHAKSLIDRRSVGVESRYFDQRFNLYGLVDYDIKFSKLNLALMTLNINFKDQSSLSLTADYRQSPLLTVSNALIGQMDPITFAPILTLRDLRAVYSDPFIYQLAEDRTLIAKSATISYSRPITPKLQSNFDFTVTDTGGTPASGGVPLQPATGTEFFYGGQLVGNGLFIKNDIFIVSARYADTQRARTYTGDFNFRVPLGPKLRISPRARFGVRNDKFGTGTFRQFQPTFRLNYYPIRQSEVEVEIGANFSNQKFDTAGFMSTSKEKGLVMSIGYRLDF